MKRAFLAVLALTFLGSIPLVAGGKGSADDLLRRSAGASYPQPFDTEADWPRTSPPISTGYYIVDSEDGAGDPYTPKPSELFVDTTTERGTWRRIISGPNQFPAEYWDSFEEGHMYFRNPGNQDDSTDNAFAGPMRIGFPFYFNGVRYDSFYVSTNGLIALSNRRYFYDSETGERTIPEGQPTAWDPESDDTRTRNDPDANGLEDPIADDWGYTWVACGGDPSNPTGGIRWPTNSNLTDSGPGPGINTTSIIQDAPIIAPFWDDWQLSQFNNELNLKEDYGQVWFKRSVSRDRLTIYYLQLSPIGLKTNPNGGTISFGANNRIGEGSPAFYVNAQVTLNRSDSTINFLYRFKNPPLFVVGNRPVDPWAVVRFNATVGVRGKARYIDDNFQEQRYTQHSTYLWNRNVFVVGPVNSETSTPNTDLAIKFKQYKNVLRVVRINYLIPDPTDGEFNISVSDPNNYELLVGDQLLGSLQPVAIFQNLTNDIQGTRGVNFQKQDLTFRTRFKIQNDILNDTIVYSRQVCVDSFALANSNVSGVRLVNFAGETVPFNGNGVPPYGFVEVKFPAYKTNQFLPNQIGRLTSLVIGEPAQCSGSRAGYGDEWAFDDTTRIRLFGIRILNSFSDNVTDFNFSRREGTLPSVNKWVSLGAEAVDGDANTFNPPPPRGEFASANNEFVTLNSPVIRMNRFDLAGNDLAPNGDEIRSFPVDLRGRSSAILSFSYQRTGVPPDNTFDRGWSDATLIGPEIRVVQDGNWETTGPVQRPDLLELDFANPSPDAYNNITNIQPRGWGTHPNLADPDKPISNNPSFTVFGGGGFRRGWHELNSDSALTKADGLRYDQFDDGKDQEFNKVFVEIPSYILDAPNDGARFFRFKLSVRANRNSVPPNPQDDDDRFYIDNTAILFPTETPDLEISLVRVNWPYTMVPASQASSVPVEVKLSNNSIIPSRAFAVQVLIKERGASDELRVYCRAQTLPFLRAQTESVKAFPVWNARQTRPGRYILAARMRIPGGDPEPLNDTTYGEFNLVFGQAFAYDPPNPTGTNDVPQFSQATGKGLNLSGANSGGFSASTAFGSDAGNRSGQIAMKFELFTQDTILGYQAHFGSLNSDVLNTTYSIYEDGGGSPSATQVSGTRMLRQRGLYDLDAQGRPATSQSDPIFNEYATYLLPKEVVLSPGKYWMAVAQMGTEGFELGATASRMGMQTTNYTTIPVLGVSGTSLIIDKTLRERNRSGQLINGSWFAYENTYRSGAWSQFSPTIGNPGYAHLAHTGQVVFYRTYTRGSWIPLIRPYFGERAFSNPPQYVDFEECEKFAPVELTDFDGESLPPAGIELYWATASETNNAGFYVERRMAGSDSEYLSLGFVQGAGSSTAPVKYDFLDADVFRGETYEYRLRQVDFDGSVSFSRAITLEYDYADALQLANKPNPFTEMTDITFSVPSASNVRLEIIDVLGNSVRVLHDGDMRPAAEKTISWDTRDNTGAEVAAGAYICRLTIGEETIVRTLNVVK